MKLRLEKGKQNELILLAKGNNTWKELSKLLNLNEDYLCRDLKNERILISEKLYNELCRISNKNFDNFIIDKLDDNWGKSKGGLNSTGSTIKLVRPQFNEKLAEFIGAVLGDGSVHSYKKGKKVGVYQIKIAGDYVRDKNYHRYLSFLAKSLFNLKSKFVLCPKNNERFLNFYSKELVEFFNEMGIQSGDKIKNQSTIPTWIYSNNSLLRACLRGLIDTDGCISRMSNRDSNLLRISFTNHDYRLLYDSRNVFISLGFTPSKLIDNKKYYISKQSEIEKYLKEIGFSNDKHKNRYNKFKSPVV